MTKSGLSITFGIAVVIVAAVAAVALYGFREMRPARYMVIYRFSGAKDGMANPNGLAVDAADNIYGTTSSGGARRWGTIFRLTPPQPSPSKGSDRPISYTFEDNSSWNIQALGLNVDSVGGSPSALTFDRTGVLYGTTATGGPPPSAGTFFKLEMSDAGWRDPVSLYSMPEREFNDSASDLVADASGAFYGTTSGRGADSRGTVFKLSRTEDGWRMDTIYRFKGGDDGAYPKGGLVLDRSGTLYGTTIGGGPDGMGTVFKLTPTETGWDETVIHTFYQPERDHEGMMPMAALTIDARGTLYGTAAAGGLRGEGVVFALTRLDAGWTERVLYNFSGRDGDGAVPNSRLVFGASGELYGTTRYGGDAPRYSGKGTVFRLAPVFRWAPAWFGWKQTTIHAFAGGEDGVGTSLSAALYPTKSGEVYGVTPIGGGGRNYGTIYQIVP
jgi:uncharacterized repeat protein (TIGR03803 family)